MAKDLTQKEVDALLAECRRIGGRDYAMLVAILNAGLRTSEIASLSTSDFHHLPDNNSYLTVRTVGGRGRRNHIDQVLLKDDVAKVLGDWISTLQPTSPMFPSQYGQGGGPMTKRSIWAVIRRLLNKSGLVGYDLISLRRFFLLTEIWTQVQLGPGIDVDLLQKRGRFLTLGPVMELLRGLYPVSIAAHITRRESLV